MSGVNQEKAGGSDRAKEQNQVSNHGSRDKSAGHELYKSPISIQKNLATDLLGSSRKDALDVSVSPL